MNPAKASGGLDTLKSFHGARPLFASSMVLLQMIIQVVVRAMLHGSPQLGFDRAGIGIVSIAGDSRRDTAGDGACGLEERFRRCFVALLTYKLGWILTEPDQHQQVDNAYMAG